MQVLNSYGCKKTVRADSQCQESPQGRSSSPYIRQYANYDQGYTISQVGRPLPRFNPDAEKFRSSIDFGTYKRLTQPPAHLPCTLQRDDRFLEPQAATRRSYQD